MTVSTLLVKQQYPLAKCHPDNSVLQAAHEMASKKANALAVIANDGKLAGILTDHDIIRCLVARNRELDLEVVRAWMTPQVITCDPSISLNDAMNLMAKNRIRHLVVVEGSRPLGVVGIRELLAAAHEEDMLEKTCPAGFGDCWALSLAIGLQRFLPVTQKEGAKKCLNKKQIS